MEARHRGSNYVQNQTKSELCVEEHKLNTFTRKDTSGQPKCEFFSYSSPLHLYLWDCDTLGRQCAWQLLATRDCLKPKPIKTPPSTSQVLDYDTYNIVLLQPFWRENIFSSERFHFHSGENLNLTKGKWNHRTHKKRQPKNIPRD